MGNYSSQREGQDGGHVHDDTIPPNRSARNNLAYAESVRVMEDVSGTTNADSSVESVVPTVFKWEHGGRHVYITGTFNNWEKQLPMHRSGNDFTYVHNLKKGKHAFKFIVDDEWRFAPG